MTSSDTAEYSWRIEQGERESLLVPVLDGDGAPRDITGWVIDAQIKTRPGGATLYTWPDEDVTLDDSGAVITIVVPHPVSATWAFTSGWWRIVVSDPASNPADPDVYRIIEGPLIVDPD